VSKKLKSLLEIERELRDEAEVQVGKTKEWYEVTAESINVARNHVLQVLQRLEFIYNRIGNKEGKMCPQCYQFPLRALPGMRAKRKGNYGHKPDCWVGKAMAELKKEL
jgi:hypothetical protein